MGNRFASGRIAIAICDRCGFQYKLKELKELVIKTKNINMLVCRSCWDPDQPQLQLGMYPVDDPQALRNPRPDSSYKQSGLNGLQVDIGGGTLGDGASSGGSRVIQWGWNPVGGARDYGLTPNNLEAQASVGSVTVTIT